MTLFAALVRGRYNGMQAAPLLEVSRPYSAFVLRWWLCLSVVGVVQLLSFSEAQFYPVVASRWGRYNGMQAAPFAEEVSRPYSTIVLR